MKLKGNQFDFETTTAGIGAFYSVCSRQVNNWVQAGMPKLGRNRYDLRTCNTWWQDNIAGSSGESESGELRAAKVEYWQSKAKITAIAAQKAADAVFPKDSVLTAWTERVVNVCTGLEALADRLPPLLTGMSPKKMIGPIKAEIRHLREGFAARGRYCDAPNGLLEAIDDFYNTESGRITDGK